MAAEVMFSVADTYLTATEFSDRIGADVRHVCLSTVARYFYLDLVLVWVRKGFGLSTEQWRRLRTFCPGAYPDEIPEPKDKRFKVTAFGSVIVLPQPNPDALMFVHFEIGPRNYSVVHAQYALDLVTRTQTDADTVRDLIAPLWLHRRAPKGAAPKVFKRTHFSSTQTRRVVKRLPDGIKHTRFRAVRTVQVVYSDKGSPIDGGRPCCHLEVRKTGADGIGNLLTLATTDHEAFWRGALALRRVNHAALARTFRSARGAPPTWSRRRDEIDGLTLSANASIILSNDWHCLPFHTVDAVAGLLRKCKRSRRLSRVFTPIDASGVLACGKARPDVRP